MARSRNDVSQKRKSAVRKQAKASKSVKLHAPKKSKSAGKSRAEGIRLFALAGRPSGQDFIRVYGPNGPKMTWEQRAKSGVPAEKFQAALASAMRQAK